MKKTAKLLLLAVMTACATGGQVKTDYDASAKFGNYKTYAIADPKGIEGSEIFADTLVQQRIENLLKESLAAEDLKQVAMDENPDLVVQYWVGVKNKEDLARVSNAPPYYGMTSYDHWAVSYERYISYEYREGTLIVDLVDHNSKKLVWRAYLQQVLEDNKDTNLKAGRRLLTQAFKSYPPIDPN